LCLWSCSNSQTTEEGPTVDLTAEFRKKFDDEYKNIFIIGTCLFIAGMIGFKVYSVKKIAEASKEEINELQSE